MVFSLYWGIGCAHSVEADKTPMSDSDTVTVSVSASASIRETTEAVLDTVSMGEKVCTIYWGDLLSGPRGALPLSLIVGKDTVIEGWLLCVSLLPEPSAIHPRASQMRLLSWGGGRILAGEPSGQTVIIDDLNDFYDAQPMGYTTAFAMFDVEGGSLDTPIGDLAPALKTLPKGFVFIEWMIERQN